MCMHHFSIIYLIIFRSQSRWGLDLEICMDGCWSWSCEFLCRRNFRSERSGSAGGRAVVVHRAPCTHGYRSVTINYEPCLCVTSQARSAGSLRARLSPVAMQIVRNFLPARLWEGIVTISPAQAHDCHLHADLYSNVLYYQ